MEAARLLNAAGPAIIEIHHIGSTSIPGVVAKPIVDLMAIGPDLAALDGARPAIEALANATHGEYGLEGRRFCTLTDPIGGLRKFHLHCFANGDHSILSHLAFRDYLQTRLDLAEDYERMKHV